MFTPPTTNHCGLTLVLDKPSRFDKIHGKLLSGLVNDWFQQACLPTVPLASTHICDLTDLGSIPNTTKKVLVLGDAAKERLMPNGRVGYAQMIPSLRALGMAAYYPQDCCDVRQVETEDEDEDADATSDSETKNDYPTRRSNYRFWTSWFAKKLVKGTQQMPGNPRIIVKPDLKKLCTELDQVSDLPIYLDIETSMRNQNLACIGLSWKGLHPTIYVVPIYPLSGVLEYADIMPFIVSLFRAFTRNTIVIHNAMFDLTVLCGFYGMPLPKAVYCTMCSNHRLFPKEEKSLAHVIAQWTWLHYHKDVNSDPYDMGQQIAMWDYNGRDVFALPFIMDAQLAYANAGQRASIEQSNESLIPYLHTSLIGLPIDRYKWQLTEQRLQQRAHNLKRICSLLTGIADFNPAGPKQCADFFHKKLGYPVVELTDTGAPKLGRKQLYKLAISYPNPAITAVIAYRKTAKDLAMLGSNLF